MTTLAGAAARLASILPDTATLTAEGRLSVGGCDLTALVAEYGTPLYVYDEETIRSQCQAYLAEFRARLPQSRVLYAAKAFLSPALTGLLAEEGLGMDVVSGGELYVAQQAGFPCEAIAFHGNNKDADELAAAIEAGVGRIILDNPHELGLLSELTAGRATPQPVMLRVTPGVDAHTHAKTTTGLRDSKFGFSLENGDAERAVAATLAAPQLELTGYHIHLGSPIYTTEPYVAGIEVMAEFAAGMRERHGVVWREFSPGGGYAVGYTPERLPPPIAEYAEVIASALRESCERWDLPLPEIHIEPGRSIVARAGVAVYTAGSRKEIPGVRTYVAIDGGMADNVRPAMYGSDYAALLANRAGEEPQETVTVAGKFCESGDVLVRDAALPRVEPGDLVAIPASGAYNLAMESNYNKALRPAVVFVRDGEARLTRRRERYEDLVALELWGEGRD